MTDTLVERRNASANRLREFQEQLTKATEICSGKACVYVTGSFGRGDASPHSDIDLFIAGNSHRDASGEEIRDLPKLDEILLKAELIQATRKLGFPEFSGDGEYLIHYTIDELVKTTGQPEDDANNTGKHDSTAKLAERNVSSPWRSADSGRG
jgi:predicted nucleotidyltransferase